VRHHEQIQEEVAEDMIKMARSLKSNATIAKDIISKDNQVGVGSSVIGPSLYVYLGDSFSILEYIFCVCIDYCMDEKAIVCVLV